MASSSSSSSSSVILESKYDVFLSFRGEDTRDNFTSHLYSALCRKKVQTFIDDRLKRGDDISPALLKTIEESSISVVIFSKHYASSKWCLDELIKILECKKMNGQVVIPVFYRVNPSDVRKQTGSFEDAFIMHEQCLKGMTGKVQKWKDALTEAANLSGWDSMVIRPESKLVDEIVSDVLKKLDAILAPSDCEGLVGIDSKVEDIISRLCIDSLDFRVVGIWGMGGIGKTTLAEAVFNKIRDQFEGCCFVRNVREDSEKSSDGLVRLKEQLLSTILGEESINIGTLNVIPEFVKRRVQRTKFLVVLDDVNNSEQLKILTGGIDQFGPGSRVLITTRDLQVLCNFEEYNRYEVKELKYQQAFQLFSNCAFKQNRPLEDELVVLSEKIVDYAKGNPLALKVLGSSLCQKKKSDWESALRKLNRISNPQIHNVLKTSYDALDREEQDIFLDSASFFKGDDRDHAMRILDGCYFSASFGLSVLVGKSLITISNEDKLEMHDLLQEMGREIVCQENVKDPSKRSRLWYFEDIYRVLRDKKGTDSIEGIFLDMAKIREMRLSCGAFVEMSNLRLLKFYNPEFHKENVNISRVHLPQGLEFLSNELRYFHWDGYPAKSLPSRFSLENLVELNLQESNIEELWKGSQYPGKLKVINVEGSQSLTTIPDLSQAIELNVINLKGCRSLVDVHSSIQNLNNLKYLYLSDCENLQGISSNIHFKSLEVLDFACCIKLKSFPQISGSIEHLSLSGSAIEEVSPSIGCLTNLAFLNLENCTRLKSLPTSICKLKSLEGINLSNCSKLESFPEILEEMESLTLLQLNGATTIKELPSSIQYLKGLRSLELRDCINLESLPSSICNLISLCQIYVSGCSKLDNLPENLGNLIRLIRVDASKTIISQLPFSVTCWKQFSYLTLAFCKLTRIPEHLCCLSTLKRLDLRGNSFESLPMHMKQLSQLQHLFISNCSKLQSLPELPSSLKGLEASNCSQLGSLPELPSSLEGVDASDLTIVPDRINSWSHHSIKFIFTNCHNLNKNSKDILADAPLRFQHMATAALRYHEEVLFYKKSPAIKFCLPGSEIPNWISYRSLGSSLTIELPPHWFSGRFIGIALCVVIGFEESFDGNDLSIVCNYSFETNSGDKVNFWYELPAVYDENNPDYQRYHRHDVSMNSDHVLIGYDPCFEARLLNGDYTSGTFNFRPSNWHSPDLPKVYNVKSCGVCPLYGIPNKIQANEAQPNISLNKLANQDSGETSDYTDTEAEVNGPTQKKRKFY